MSAALYLMSSDYNVNCIKNDTIQLKSISSGEKKKDGQWKQIGEPHLHKTMFADPIIAALFG